MQSVEQRLKAQGISDEEALRLNRISTWKAMEHYGVRDYLAWSRFIDKARERNAARQIGVVEVQDEVDVYKRVSKGCPLLYEMLERLITQQERIKQTEAELAELLKEKETPNKHLTENDLRLK